MLEKKAKNEQMIDAIREEREREIREQQQRNAAIERKRKHQLQAKKAKEEEMKKNIKQKIEREEEAMKSLAQQRRKEQMLIKAERDLQKQMKKENLDRINRKRQYQLEETMHRVKENDEKSSALKKQKEDLIKLRRKNAHEAKVKKDKLMAVLEKSKMGGGSCGIKKLLKQITANEEILDLKSSNRRPEDEPPSQAPPSIADSNTSWPEPFEAPAFTKDFDSEFQRMTISLGTPDSFHSLH